MPGKKPVQRISECVALATSIFALLYPVTAQSASAMVTRKTEIRLEHYVDAPALGTLEQGSVVETLENYAGWIKVRAQNRVGWVRANSLSGAGAERAQIATLEGGRSAGGNDQLVTSGIRSLESPTRHALIIGVGEYDEPTIVPLKGVKHDMESATKMATAMGISNANIRYLRDKQATAKQIEQELQNLNARTQSGDRVFVYFTGHGARWYDPGINKDNCVEALMPTDGKPLTNQKMASLLKPISDKADKLIVFYDACHSGGIVGQPLSPTRSLSLNTHLTPKFTPFSAPQSCYQPANIKTRSLSSEAEKAGMLPQNFVQISSSRPDEVSFDDERNGGLATRAWRDCMLGEAKDLDKSGGISVDEITSCAQAKLDGRFAYNEQYSVPHITVGGNKRFIPSLMASAMVLRPATEVISATPVVNSNQTAPQLSHQVSLPPATSLPVSANGLSHTAAPAAASVLETSTPHDNVIATEPDKVTGPLATLNDVFAQRDPRYDIKVKLDRSVLRIGKDALSFSVTSSHDGYLYIVLLGSDNKTFYMLYPNDLDQTNFIKAKSPTALPRKGWEIFAAGPAGVDRLLFVVADSPRHLMTLGSRKTGPFLTGLTDDIGRANLQWILTAPASTTGSNCINKGNQGDFSQQQCSSRFGAALLEITEE